ARRVDALLLRRGRGADAQAYAALRDGWHARHLAPGLEGVDRARADATGPRTLRRRPLAAVPYRRRSFRGARSRRQAPGKNQGARRAVARGGTEVRRAAA